MKTSTNGLKFISKEEGNFLYAYDDANSKKVGVGDPVRGTLTIGVGHTSAAGAPTVTPGMVITQAESESILAKDLSKVEAEVTKLVKVPLNQNQFDALVSFQFNTGGLARAQILRNLNAGDYDGAANAFMNWTKANGNPTLLQGRRKREIELFKSKTNTGKGGLGSAAGVAVGTGAAASQAPSHLIPYIIAGGMLLAVVALIGVDVYNYKKQQNVNNAKPE